MLTEWYFCCCINASPTNTKVFLHIWEILQDRDSDWRILSLAFEELQKTEIWPQLYLLQDVLATLHREGLPQSTQTIIESYCRNLLEFLPQKESEMFGSLLDSAYFSYTRETIHYVEACAAILAETRNRPISPTPYQDMKEFIAETILLAIIADLIENNAEFSPQLSVASKESPVIKLLFETALQHQYGRMAFCLAAQITNMLGYPQQYLLSNISNTGHGLAALEPDLMRVMARVLFTRPSTASPDPQHQRIIQQLINESITLEKLRNLAANTNELMEEQAGILSRIGYDSTEIAQGLSIIYWQLTLWGMAADLDEQAAARFLSKLWLKPGLPLWRAVKVYGPFIDENRDAWVSQLQVLMQLRGLRPDIRATSSRDISVSRSSRWALFSPWVCLKSHTARESPAAKDRYPTAENPVVLIRLLAGAYIGIQILRKLPGEIEHDAFSTLIAHASSVLSLYQEWLRNYENLQGQEDQPLKPSLTGLALFARDQIEFAGRGNIASIPPSIFLNILREKSANNQQHPPPQTSLDEREFRESILPEVLMSWISSAYTGASESSGARRWLKLIPEVYSHYKCTSHDKRSEREAALIMRFISGHEHKPFNWQQIPWDKTSHRLLLLTDHLPGTAWIKPRWKEPDSTKKAIKLVRSIERLAAIDDDTLVHKGEWCKDWLNCMNSVIEKKDLDRFTRLRLIKLLDADIFKDWLEGQELIVLLLLEYGVYYELKQMFEKIFFSGKNQELFGINYDLQQILAKALYKDIEISSQDQESRVNAEDPRSVQREIDRVEYISSVLARLAWDSNHAPSRNQPGSMRKLLRQLQVESLKRQVKSIRKEVAAPVNQYGEKKCLSLWAESSVKPWMLHKIAYDPNTLSVAMSTVDLHTNGSVNLFEMSPLQHQAFRNEATEKVTWVVAIVVNKDNSNSRDERYTFNCGLAFTLAETSDKYPPLSPGLHVRLPIQKKLLQQGRSTWCISKSDIAGITTLSQRLSVGDILEVDIVERTLGSSNKRAIEIEQEEEFPLNNASFDIWDANLTAGFHRVESKIRRKTFARLEMNRQLIPIDLDLTNLILEGMDYHNTSVAVLTLIDPGAHTRLHEKAWRFSTHPGNNYLLGWSDFVEEDAVLLESKIQSLADPKGLLVVVTLVTENDGVHLRLVSDAIDDRTLTYQYPDLCVPFDQRNLKWRDLFSEGNNLVANHTAAGWRVQVPLPIPGFPQSIRIEWEEGDPATWLQQAELSVSRWHPRAGKLVGVYVKVESLYVPKSEYQQFLNRWLHLKKGDRIQLARVIGKVTSSGTVLCKTKEKTTVFVDVESFTMEPLMQGRPLGLLDGLRTAEIAEEPRWHAVLPDFYSDERSLKIEADEVDHLPGQPCSGIFIEVPADPGNTRYKVLWQGADKAYSLSMSTSPQERIYPGARITGHMENGRWRWRIESAYVRCQALWSLNRNWEPDGSDISYLGMIFDQNEKQYKALAQIRPGELAFLPGKPAHLTHLTVGDGKEFINGLQRDMKTTNHSSNVSWVEGQKRYRRAVLTISQARILTGNCQDESLRGQTLILKDVQMFLYPKADGYCSLKRVFRIQWINDSRAKSQEKVVAKDAAYWQERIKEYFALHDSEPARRLVVTAESGVALIHSSHDLMVPQNSSWSEWTKKATVPESEMPFMNPRQANYSRDARAVLFKSDGDTKIYASYRRVSPLSPVAYMKDVGGVFDQFIPLTDRLYYIGPEYRNPFTGETYAEPYHRFESGWGKMLLAPESRLLFEGDAFHTSELLLNAGDYITGVTFRTTVNLVTVQENEALEEEETDKRVDCIIEINTFQFNTRERAIFPSPATRLYRQRHDYQIIHILHLRAYLDDSEPAVDIEYVEAFNEKGIDSTWSYEVRASLTPASQQRILNRLRSRPHNTADELDKLTIYGRLDEETFKETHGAVVLFEHVRLSFEESDEAPGLRNGEQIFLRAGKISSKKVPNDTVLFLTWRGPRKEKPLLDEADVGADFSRSLLLFRRFFSVRENLLHRILSFYGPGQLENQKLLVLVEKKGKGIQFSLTEHPPLRSPEVIEMISAQQKLPLAAVSKSDPHRIVIELKPAVFSELTADQIESRPAELEKGALVQIYALPNKQFRIQLAAYGDLRYVGEGRRFGLALPKNFLFKDETWRQPGIYYDSYWSKREAFTIGGLPNLTPLPSPHNQHSPAWEVTRAQECITLMETPHPRKIVLLERDSSGKVRFSLAPKSSPVGSLRMEQDKLTVHYMPLNKTRQDANQAELQWHQLTFGEESVVEIIKRIKREKWRYHDHLTATITYQDDNPVVNEDLTGEHDCWRGPLFFERTSESLRLRYNRKNFLRFGFPVEELILSLLRKPERRAFYPVAGVPEEGGLWIELAPGRIVELPSRLIDLPGKANASSLPEMIWEAFAPGDWVELEITSSSRLLVDRILLKDWRAGARGVCSPQSSLLPIHSHDGENGSLTLGAGLYTIKFPTASADPGWDLAVLYPNNQLHNGRDYLPEPGDVVLLGLNEHDEPAVLGFSDLVPEPDRKNLKLWDGDPLAEDMFITDGNNVFYDKHRLRQLIKAVGGALPVTVEFHWQLKNRNQFLLYFSRRHQRATTLHMTNRVGIARIIGLHPDGSSALLRLGGDIIKLPMCEVISGIPNHKIFFQEAANVLRESGELIYIYGDGKGKLRIGLPANQDAERKELLVKALHLLSPNQVNNSEIGLICRTEDSLAFYWLSARNAAWAELSAQQLRLLFLCSEKDYFKVSRFNKDGVSIVHTIAAQKEFKSYKLGKQLVIRLIEKIGDEPSRQLYLAESFSANVVLVFETYDNKVVDMKETRTVEVSFYSLSPYRVTVAPIGQRHQTLDLPAWMLKQLETEEYDRRQEFINYLRWREEKGLLAEPSLPLRQISNTQLNQLLCQRYENQKGNRGNSQFTIDIALEWKRRNQNESEMDLAYAVMVILLLENIGYDNKNQSWRAKARELAQNLGGRALRSGHIEILYRKWLSNPQNRNYTSPLWRRLTQVIASIKNPLTQENILAIKQLRRSLGLRIISERSRYDLKEIQEITDALSASIGLLSGNRSWRGDENTLLLMRYLVEIHRSLPFTESSEAPLLEQIHIDKLERILRDINQHGLDITLLDNLINVR